jgi:hypothetical protein
MERMAFGERKNVHEERSTSLTRLRMTTIARRNTTLSVAVMISQVQLPGSRSAS